MSYRVPYNKPDIANHLYLRLILRNVAVLILILHLFLSCAGEGALIIAFGLDKELFILAIGFLATLMLLTILIIRIMKYHIFLLLTQIITVIGWIVFALWLMRS